jgi:ABC-type bacteriocin/lantibiotic exporter with double-glycine peptidase domain
VFYLDRHRRAAERRKVYRVTGGVLVPLCRSCKLCVVLFISALLVIINPLMALVVAAVLGGAYALLYKFARGALQRAGRVSVEAGTLRARHALESLSGAKEIKLLGREAEFVERFREPSLRWAMRRPGHRRSLSCRATRWRPLRSASS